MLVLVFLFIYFTDDSVTMPSMEDTELGAVSYEAVVSAVRAVTLPISTTYRKYSPRDRYIIGKYANETGSTAAGGKFRSKFPNLNGSTVREFRKKYLDQLKSASKNNRPPQKGILPLPRGRPLLLGVKIDEGVRKFLSRHYDTIGDGRHFQSR